MPPKKAAATPNLRPPTTYFSLSSIRKFEASTSSDSLAGTAAHGGPDRELPVPFELAEAPTHKPTNEEWADPYRVLEDLQVRLGRAGMGKLIPPESWKPKLSLDQETRFTVQLTPLGPSKPPNLYAESSPTSLETSDTPITDPYVATLASFHASRGTPFQSHPVVERRPISLSQLQMEVHNRGGFRFVCENKKWAEVARAIGLTKEKRNTGTSHTLKMVYARNILPHDVAIQGGGGSKLDLAALLEPEILSQSAGAESEDKSGTGQVDQSFTSPPQPTSPVVPETVEREEVATTALSDDNGSLTVSATAITVPSAPSTSVEHPPPDITAPPNGSSASCNALPELEIPTHHFLDDDGELSDHDTDDGDSEFEAASVPTPERAQIPPKKQNGVEGPTRRSARASRAKVTKHATYAEASDSDGDVDSVSFSSEMSAPRTTSPEPSKKTLSDHACQVCRTSTNPTRLLLCDGCDTGWHTFCLDPPLERIPKGKWFCPVCSGGLIGVVDGRSYEITGFMKAAEMYKEAYLRRCADGVMLDVKLESEPANAVNHASPTATAQDAQPYIHASDFERSFWQHVYEADGEGEHIGIGSVNPCEGFGGGFLDPEKAMTQGSPVLGRCAWNGNMLALLPSSILLHMSRIPPVLLPQLCAGMLFSHVGWRTAPLGAPLASYLWGGDGRTWYAIGSDQARKFEDLVGNDESLIKWDPGKLLESGVRVTKVFQRPGDWIVVTAGSYYAYIDHGFTLSTSSVLAPASWLPHARRLEALLRNLRKPAPFSLNEVIITAARGVGTEYSKAMWLNPAIEGLRGREERERAALRERFESILEETDADARGLEERCENCLAKLFISGVTCPCGTWSCADCTSQGQWSCKADPKHLPILRVGVPDSVIAAAHSGVAKLVSRPSEWLSKLRKSLLTPRPQLRSLQQLVVQGEKLPVSMPEVGTLQEFLASATAWVTKAEHLLENKRRKVYKSLKQRKDGTDLGRSSRRTIAAVDELLREVEPIPFDCPEIQSLQYLRSQVHEFRERSVTLLTTPLDYEGGDWESQIASAKEALEGGYSLDVECEELEKLESRVRQLEWCERSQGLLNGDFIKLDDVIECMNDAGESEVDSDNPLYSILKRKKFQGERWRIDAVALLKLRTVTLEELTIMRDRAKVEPLTPELFEKIESIIARVTEWRKDARELLQEAGIDVDGLVGELARKSLQRKKSDDSDEDGSVSGDDIEMDKSDTGDRAEQNDISMTRQQIGVHTKSEFDDKLDEHPARQEDEIAVIAKLDTASLEKISGDNGSNSVQIGEDANNDRASLHMFSNRELPELADNSSGEANVPDEPTASPSELLEAADDTTPARPAIGDLRAMLTRINGCPVRPAEIGALQAHLRESDRWLTDAKRVTGARKDRPLLPALEEMAINAINCCLGSQDGRELYCLCQTPELGFMVECDVCKEWYHGKCIRISQKDAKVQERYVCPCCNVNLPIFRVKRPQYKDIEALARSGRKLKFASPELEFLETIVVGINRFKREIYDFMKLGSEEMKSDDGKKLRGLLRRTEGLLVELAAETNMLRNKVGELLPLPIEPDDPNAVYCVCRGAAGPDEEMVGCDRCGEWYHFQCMGLTAEKVASLPSWICPPCERGEPSPKFLGKSVPKTTTKKYPIKAKPKLVPTRPKSTRRMESKPSTSGDEFSHPKKKKRLTESSIQSELGETKKRVADSELVPPKKRKSPKPFFSAAYQPAWYYGPQGWVMQPVPQNASGYGYYHIGPPPISGPVTVPSHPTPVPGTSTPISDPNSLGLQQGVGRGQVPMWLPMQNWPQSQGSRPSAYPAAYMSPSAGRPHLYTGQGYGPYPYPPTWQSVANVNGSGQPSPQQITTSLLSASRGLLSNAVANGDISVPGPFSQTYEHFTVADTKVGDDTVTHDSVPPASDDTSQNTIRIRTPQEA
ncbi:PLU-1-domain-containing protein [Gonapodya prolifera JEL478]|uniref:PLU-1-domain-containing protein n=1 Tax=Gonapodya prolifera (strain JEL478) TaxID=1344416 RepID=A0A139AT28_GONPJ|nr:PLU-1-domain-containing protein [Gonapodya prolifera JEL478]|eukprot:KXS19869.1 PLU-1-domain-containing protein [Gonapodya prolifera JEL478]